MPILQWIGKEKVVNHHLEVPCHELSRTYSFDEEGQKEKDNGSENGDPWGQYARPEVAPPQV